MNLMTNAHPFLVSSVKPALFDLFLAAGIALYLGLVYLVIEVSDFKDSV